MTVKVTTLPNGLRVATDEVDSVETVSLGVWVGVGTRDEVAAENGVAHLVEHMLFKGTPRRDAFAISQEIEAVGGHLNAYTTREHTAYYAKVLKEDGALALDIITDMVQHALLDEGELAKERTVVLQEIGQAEDTPDDIIFDHFQATAFPDQAIGRPVLGTPEIVANLPRETLSAYVRGHYGASKLIVAAAGNIRHDRMVEMAGRLFGELPVPGPGDLATARFQGGDMRVERDLEQVHLVLGFQGVDHHHPDHFALQVLSTLLGGGMSSRLFQEIREKRGLVYSIYSFASPFRDAGVFGIYAGTGADQVAELVPVVCDEICRVSQDATDEEVLRARAQLKASLLMGLESTMARCEQLGQQMLVHGRPLPLPELLTRLEAIDSATIRRVAGDLRRQKPVVTALGPLASLESYDAIAARLA